MGPQLHGDLQQRQPQQGKGSTVDQAARQAQLPERVEQLQRPQRPRHQRGEQHEQHQGHHAQARGGEEHGAAGARWFGAGGHGRPQGPKAEKESAAHGGHKKAPPMAGP